ncbi:MAG: hypothetical protein II140_03215, partial [Paludibacteraceae bacterium]|nr:hypothetical protein [Paludibacteraceae bacterium]
VRISSVVLIASFFICVVFFQCKSTAFSRIMQEFDPIFTKYFEGTGTETVSPRNKEGVNSEKSKKAFDLYLLGTSAQFMQA